MACTGGGCNLTAFIGDRLTSVFATSDPNITSIGGIIALIFFAGVFFAVGLPFELSLAFLIMLAAALAWSGLLPGFVGWAAFAIGGAIIIFALLKLARR